MLPELINSWHETTTTDALWDVYKVQAYVEGPIEDPYRWYNRIHLNLFHAKNICRPISHPICRQGSRWTNCLNFIATTSCLRYGNTYFLTNNNVIVKVALFRDIIAEN